MGRIGFWQLLLDDKLSYWEAQRINDAHDAADAAYGYAASAGNAAAQIGARVDAMSREIIMLRTALTVLTQTLRDTKAIDEQLLDARLEAALDEAFPPPAPAAAPIDPAKMQITCLRCRKQVLARSTFMTGDGPVCERPCSP